MEFYKNKNIETLEGEVWSDVYGYDGIYSASNLGRIKSETRYVNNGKGGRLVKERILSQAKCIVGKHGQSSRLSVGLSWNNISRGYEVSTLVWCAFNGPVEMGKVVMHRNKNALDNRLSNLDAVTISQSHSRNWQMGKLTHLEDIHSTQTGSRWNEEHGVWENGELTEKLCNACFQHKPAKRFGAHNTCPECRSIRKGIIEVGKISKLKALADAGLRRCYLCKQEKSISDFYSNDNRCKVCAKEQGKRAGIIKTTERREFKTNWQVKSIEGEEWVEASGFDDYMVSNMGRVKSKNRVVNGRWRSGVMYGESLMKATISGGRAHVSLVKDGKPSSIGIARLVYFSFNPDTDKNFVLEHLDGNPENNRLTNLSALNRSALFRKQIQSNPNRLTSLLNNIQKAR